MNNVEFEKVYLNIINNDNNIINESFGKTMANMALIGSTLFGACNSAQAANEKGINNSSKQKIEQTAQKYDQLSEDELFIAKTLYSEASTLGSYEEHLAIGNIIQNRIKHKGFELGKLKSAIDVVKQKNGFTSVLKHNVNWDQYEVNLNKFTRYDAQIAKILMDPSRRLGR